jgi:hypothetical protein
MGAINIEVASSTLSAPKNNVLAPAFLNFEHIKCLVKNFKTIEVHDPFTSEIERNVLPCGTDKLLSCFVAFLCHQKIPSPQSTHVQTL